MYDRREVSYYEACGDTVQLGLVLVYEEFLSLVCICLAMASEVNLRLILESVVQVLGVLWGVIGPNTGLLGTRWRSPCLYSVQ